MLEVIEISKSFGGVAALDGVSFSAAPGERLGLIGPNGSGKTTTFNVVSGFLRCDGGKLVLGGRDVTGYSLERTARTGLVRTFQHDASFPGLSVRENVELPLGSRYGRDRVGRRAALDQLLAVTGLAAHAGAEARNLSYGHRRLLGVAVAAALEPSVLMLDEPAAGLSTEERRTLTRTLRALNEGGMTLVVIEHDMEFIDSLCERVVVLNLGRQLAAGTPAEVRNDPAVAEAYLGTVQHQEVPR